MTMLGYARSKERRRLNSFPRWGIDINAGWRAIMERLLVRLEAVITAQPVDERDRLLSQRQHEIADLARPDPCERHPS